MNIISTYADDPTKPSASAVRHLVTDSLVTAINGPAGPVSFFLDLAADDGSSFTYSFNPRTLPDGNYFADGVEFYSFFGDVNGDRTVDSVDAAIFNATFGASRGNPSYLSCLDFNDDGIINAADNFQFKHRYGTTLAP